jgi:hypothetical protein
VKAWDAGTDLNPSFRYPAASQYQLDRGIIHLFSHGRLRMYLARLGLDIVGGEGGRWQGWKDEKLRS